MIKNYLLALLLFPALIWSQGITVSTTAFTPTQLVTDVLLASNCVEISNITTSSACGIGYFNANGGGFPFPDGILLRSGQASSTAGPYTGLNISTTCSNQTDPDLQQMMNTYGYTGNNLDATFLKFHFVAQTNTVNFDYIFASQEYGQFQCSAFADVVAFILTDLVTGVSTNLATLPNSNLPVSANTIRDALFNPNCTSFNSEYFGSYNVNNPASSFINMKGQTIPLQAIGNVIPGNSYSLKIVVGDYGDPALDSAIFLRSGFYSPGLCSQTIQMIAFLDDNNNGIKDDDEINFKHGAFTHTINNSGDEINTSSPNGTVFVSTTSSTDTYDLNYTIDPAFSPYFSTSINFNDITVAEGSGLNAYYFPIATTQPYHDVAVSLISSNQPQPGFDYHQTIGVTNNGTVSSSGTLTFTKDPLLDITSVSQPGIADTPTGFTYAYTDLLPNESLNFTVTSLVPTIPTVALGDYVTSGVTVAAATVENNTENNTNTLSEIIVGAYDPNDKMESHGASIPFDSFGTDEYLEYTIRFQNTGTYYATRVSIEDELEAQLDPSSFQMISASHAYTLTRVNNKLVWTFNDILLPSMEDSEEASQGYVRFRIKPNAGPAVGDIITNQASIFFDFNPPIITNLFATEFTTTLSTPDFNELTLVVYPNPSKSMTTISSKNDIIETLKITDVTGKTIKAMTVDAATISINVADLSTGIYLLELSNSKQERVVKKLIIN